MKRLRVNRGSVNNILLVAIEPSIGMQKSLSNVIYTINIADYLQSQILSNAHMFFANPSSDVVNYNKYSTDVNQFKAAYSFLLSGCQGSFFTNVSSYKTEFLNIVRNAFSMFLAASLTLENSNTDVAVELTLPTIFTQTYETTILKSVEEILGNVGGIGLVEDFGEIFSYMMENDELDTVMKYLIALGPYVEKHLDLKKFYSKMSDNPNAKWKQIVVQAWLSIKNIYVFERIVNDEQNSNL